MSIEKYVFPEFRLSSLKLLRCLKLSTVEVLYSGLIKIFCIYWFPLQFWYGHWFLTKLLPASRLVIQLSKETKVKAGKKQMQLLWLFGTCLHLVWIWPVAPYNWSGLVYKQIVLNEGAEIINLLQFLSYFRVVMCRTHNEPRCLFGPYNDVSVCVCVYVSLYIHTSITWFTVTGFALHVSNYENLLPLSNIGLFLHPYWKFLKSCGICQTWLLVLKEAL